VGKAYDPEVLCALLERDRIFFDGSGGGVTLSGGEPMAQDEKYVRAVLERLWRRGICVDVDTCGHAPYEHFQAAMPYTDVFLYDIKAVEPALHERFTGVSNRLILDNARRLSGDGARMHVRVPVIPGFNIPRHDSTHPGSGEMGRIIRFVRENLRAEQVSLMPYHRMGQDKRARLSGWQGENFEEPGPQVMEAVLSAWQKAGFENILVGG